MTTKRTKPTPRRVYIPAYVATSWDDDGGELTFESPSAVVARGDRQLAREIVRRAGAHGVAYQRSVRRALAPLCGDGR